MRKAWTARVWSTSSRHVESLCINHKNYQKLLDILHFHATKLLWLYRESFPTNSSAKKTTVTLISSQGSLRCSLTPQGKQGKATVYCYISFCWFLFLITEHSGRKCNKKSIIFICTRSLQLWEDLGNNWELSCGVCPELFQFCISKLVHFGTFKDYRPVRKSPTVLAVWSV